MRPPGDAGLAQTVVGEVVRRRLHLLGMPAQHADCGYVSTVVGVSGIKFGLSRRRDERLVPSQV